MAHPELNTEKDNLAHRLVASGLITAPQAKRWRAGDEPFRLGRFDIVRWLAEGASGELFAAVCAENGLRVVVKVISLESVSSGERQASLDFCRAFLPIQQPHLARVYDVGRQGNALYLVTEQVPGEGLDEVLAAGGPMPEIEAARLAWQAARGLESLHAADLVHGNLKPGNLRLTPAGVVKLTDAGLWRFQSQTDPGDGLIPCSFAFTPPERFSSEEKPGAEGDMFSLGAVLYLAVCGVLPFPDGPMHGTLQRDWDDLPRNPRAVHPNLSEPMAMLLVDLMQPDRRLRCPNAAEALRELEAFFMAMGEELPTDEAEEIMEPTKIERPAPTVVASLLATKVAASAAPPSATETRNGDERFPTVAEATRETRVEPAAAKRAAARHVEFDPYLDWLQIPLGPRPPHWYALLGLRPLENNEQVIADAFHHRFTIVRQYQVGDREDAAVRLLDELSDAYQGLTTPSLKQELDGRLRAEGHLPPEPVVAPQIVEADEEFDLLPIELVPDQPPARPLPKAKDPWQECENSLAAFLATSDAEHLLRGEHLAELVDPAHGRLRFARLAMRRHADVPRYQTLLLDAASKHDAAVCGACFEPVAPPPLPKVTPVEIDDRGNVRSPACSVSVEPSVLFNEVEIADGQIVWTEPPTGSCLSRQGLGVLALAVLVPVAVLIVPVTLFGWVDKSLLLPLAFGNFVLGSVLGTLAWRYRPRFETGLEAAWEVAVPNLLTDPPSDAVQGFLSGLCRATAPPYGPHVRPRVEEAQRQYDEWSATNQAAREPRAYLFYARLRAALEHHDGDAREILQAALASCAEGTLPFNLLDTVTGDGRLLRQFPPRDLHAARWHFVRACRAKGFTVSDLVELARLTHTVRRLFPGEEPEVRGLLAAWYAYQDVTILPLAFVQVMPAWEMVDEPDGDNYLDQPDLLAVSADRQFAVHGRGIRFRTAFFTDQPLVRVEQVPGGLQGGNQPFHFVLSVGPHQFPTADPPTALLAALKAFCELGFQQLRPRIRELLADRERGALRPITFSNWFTCPRCGEPLLHTPGHIAARWNRESSGR